MNNLIVEELISTKMKFLRLTEFSNKPGIYAIFFHGQHFPLPDYKPGMDEIIYIGKTESSQLSRDSKTHFSSGKTGSSTLRRTLGALLAEGLHLIPIPRSEKDIKENRFSSYKFNEMSEDILTRWMKSNLSLSFYEFTRGRIELHSLENTLINMVIPVLNIAKNSRNSFNPYLKRCRKKISEIAYSNVPDLFSEHAKVSNHNISSKNVSRSIYLYENLWRDNLNDIISILENGVSNSIQLEEEAFKDVGNRGKYNFCLEIKDLKDVNNTSGSAVSRDLYRVLFNDQRFKKIASKKKVILKMGVKYILTIEMVNLCT